MFEILKVCFPQGWFSFVTTKASVRFLGESETKERKKEISGTEILSEDTKKCDDAVNENIVNFDDASSFR